jgi:hypothetical protein
MQQVLTNLWCFCGPAARSAVTCVIHVTDCRMLFTLQHTSATSYWECRALATIVWRTSDAELAAQRRHRGPIQQLAEAIFSWYLGIPPVRERLEAYQSLWRRPKVPMHMLFLYSLTDEIVPSTGVQEFIHRQV